jgi:hypothetical protein
MRGSNAETESTLQAVLPASGSAGLGSASPGAAFCRNTRMNFGTRKPVPVLATSFHHTCNALIYEMPLIDTLTICIG